MTFLQLKLSQDFENNNREETTNILCFRYILKKFLSTGKPSILYIPLFNLQTVLTHRERHDVKGGKKNRSRRNDRESEVHVIKVPALSWRETIFENVIVSLSMSVCTCRHPGECRSGTSERTNGRNIHMYAHPCIHMHTRHTNTYTYILTHSYPYTYARIKLAILQIVILFRKHVDNWHLLWYWRVFHTSSHFYRQIYSWARPRSQTLSETSHGSWGRRIRAFWFPAWECSDRPFAEQRTSERACAFITAGDLLGPGAKTRTRIPWSVRNTTILTNPDDYPTKWRPRLNVSDGLVRARYTSSSWRHPSAVLSNVIQYVCDVNILRLRVNGRPKSQ